MTLTSAVQYKIYPLNRGSVWQIHYPGHLPTSSHNFAWRGAVNHDRITTLTSQIMYDPTLLSGNSKIAYPQEISLWIWNLFTHNYFGCFAIDSETIDRHFNAVYFDVITGPGHVNHMITTINLSTEHFVPTPTSWNSPLSTAPCFTGSHCRGWLGHQLQSEAGQAGSTQRLTRSVPLR